ncbi:nuclear transport factor 2 family protein [Streptomyces sp. GbtcB6]|uniref:nuclear transport factor 2 family protein n=1 Tax=Streptomyces sp. GbtcB6 TaxID=2824751 RepID=UPI001C30147F|nr:nuclear transport factor 2 family protein [Streptomyces sp. GbtcB6]
MKTAAELIRAFTRSFRQGGVDEAVQLFADDATFQLPYLASVSIQSSYHGREEIKGFLQLVLDLYPDWAFDPADTKILIDTPDQAFAEYIARPTAAPTGRKIEHLFMGRLVAENGKIKLLREALNTVAAAQALMPGGPADIPMPVGVIRSF